MSCKNNILLVSMPYAKFESDWFARVPNLNLGSASACLAGRGRRPLPFHFHLDFIPFLSELGGTVRENFHRLADMGVEYFSIDYVFATLLFEEAHRRSAEKMRERLEPLDLGLSELEVLRAACGDFIDRCLAKLDPHLPEARWAAFSSSHFQVCSSLLLALKMKEKNPEITVIFGGKDCTGGSGYQLLSRFPFIEYVGVTECEPTLLHLSGDQESVPPGVLFRKKKGKIGRSEKAPGIDLDDSPHPSYDLDSLPLGPEEIILPLELGRGCTWGRCTFCPDRSYQIECRTKSALRISKEIDHYLSLSPHLTRYIILDADALKDPAEITRLADLLGDKDLTFVFGELRAEKIDRGILESFMSIGRWQSPFQVGVESFSERLLGLMDKGLSVIKNVEAIKAAAELGAPMQFNIITSFPRMTPRDLEENLSMIDRISHLLSRENIHLFPSEFYLPPDCEIYDRDGHYRIRRTRESTFSNFFNDFDFHSLGNYPHYVAFDNQEEQLKMSGILRRRLEEFQAPRAREGSLTCRETGKTLAIEKSDKDGNRTWRLISPEKEIYLAGMEGIRELGEVAGEMGLPEEKVRSFLEGLEEAGLIIISGDRCSFLSLATGGA